MDDSSLETTDEPSDPADLSGAGRPTIRFVNYHETYSGTSGGGRRWVITPTLTGWRLEFRDPGRRARHLRRDAPDRPGRAA
jgi:hypothetical protein